MEIIKKLVNQMYEELDDAEEYISCASRYKEDYPDLYSMYLDLATQELTHADRLHSKAVDLIKNYEGKETDTYKTMKYAWDFEHERLKDLVTELKYKMSTIKTM